MRTRQIVRWVVAIAVYGIMAAAIYHNWHDPDLVMRLALGGAVIAYAFWITRASRGPAA
jgi:uncharacterized MnhB-related membrane protein